jgi:hypothetical protein
MSRSPSRSAWNHLPGQALLITSIACLILASPADARIGGLIKKVKDKAAKAQGQKAEPEAAADEGRVEYDDLVIELTNDRIQRILAAFEGARGAGAGRPTLVEKLNKANDERSAFAEKHWEAIQALRMKRSDVEVCYHDRYEEAQGRRKLEYTQKALTDPAIREKFARVAQENNAAAARGDSAALERATQAFQELTALTREDSLKVRQSCGPIPPHTAEEDRLDAMDQNIAALNEQIRKVDENVAEAQARQGGLNQGQWGMALERIRNYIAWRQSKSSMKSATRFFSAAEIEAMEKYLEKLRAVVY